MELALAVTKRHDVLRIMAICLLRSTSGEEEQLGFSQFMKVNR